MSDSDCDVELAVGIAQLPDGRTVATAESLTAGRIAETFACVAGAADLLAGVLVAYREPVKRSVLGVTASSALPLVCAEQMAEWAARLFDAAVCVATTGLAGDTPVDGVEPGTVFVGLSIDGRQSTLCHQFDGPPTSVCDQARHQALCDLLQRLTGNARTR